MNYRILTRRSTYLNRTIIYEVNGEVKQISAPRGIYSFEQLEEQIQKSILGESQPLKEAPPLVGEAEQKKSASKKSKKTTSPEKEKDSEQ